MLNSDLSGTREEERRLPDGDSGGTHDKLRAIVISLPTDFESFGYQTRENGESDCSCGCKYFLPLKDLVSDDHGTELISMDWGVCTNPKSPRCGLLTFEHQGGATCFVPDPRDE